MGRPGWPILILSGKSAPHVLQKWPQRTKNGAKRGPEFAQKCKSVAKRLWNTKTFPWHSGLSEAVAAARRTARSGVRSKARRTVRSAYNKNISGQPLNGCLSCRGLLLTACMIPRRASSGCPLYNSFIMYFHCVPTLLTKFNMHVLQWRGDTELMMSTLLLNNRRANSHAALRIARPIKLWFREWS